MFHVLGIHHSYLMKGLDMASTVRMNHEGCTIINALRFLRSLWKSHGTELRFRVPFLKLCQGTEKCHDADQPQVGVSRQKPCPWP